MTSPRPALLFVLLLLAPSLAPVALATHDVPDEPAFPSQPRAPESPVATASVIPVDHALEDAANRSREANEAVEPTYNETRDRFNESRDAVPVQGFITLYRDGTGPDRRGGFGDWSQRGSEAWDARNRMGPDQSRAYTTAIQPDGTYPGGAQSLLLTPELDLRTGVIDPQTRAARDQVNPLFPLPLVGSPTDFSVSSIYRFVYATADDRVNHKCFLGVGLVGGCVLDNPLPPQDVAPRDGTVLLKFDRRYNLATGLDGMQIMVFSGAAPPSGLVRPHECDLVDRQDQIVGEDVVNANADPNPDCTIVQTLERGYREGTARAVEGGPAYTGFADWETEALDLTPWTEQSVWVGFYFASMSIFSNSYFTTAGFTEGAGFYGFGLDGLALTSHAPPLNLRVRPLLEPSLRPLGTDRPTLPVNGAIPVVADVLNTGQTALEVTIEARVRDAQDQQVLERASHRIVLPPGAVHHESVSFSGRGAGHYRAEIEAKPTNATLANADADPGDSVQGIDFDVQTVHALRAGEIRRGAPTARLGEAVEFSMLLENLGNVPETAKVEAGIIDVSDPSDPQVRYDLLTHRDGQLVKMITVGAHSTYNLSWEAKGIQEGQYRLFVRVNDGRPFEASELQPDLLRPYEAAYASQAHAIDGVLGADEWAGATVEKIQFQSPYALLGTPNFDEVRNGTLRVLNDEDRLYLGVTVDEPSDANTNQLREFDALTALFDDGGDGNASNGGEDAVFINGTLTEDRHYDAATAGWALDGSQDPATMAARTPQNLGNGRGTWTYEIVRPLGPGKDLETGPGGLLGLLLVADDMNHPDFGSIDTRVNYPPAAHDRDGESFRSADGRLDDEMAAWRPIRLAMPPAPLPPDVNVPLRLFSLGFGIERSPPPFFLERLADCQNLTQWHQTGMIVAPGAGTPNPDTERWNCAPYGPDGHVRLFEGMAPGSQCGPRACEPWSGIGTSLERRNPNELVTPPIEVGDVEQPYLLVQHQYSTQVFIRDQPLNPNFETRQTGISIFTVARVYMEEWSPDDQQWENRTLLVPENGYSSERSVGIYNPIDFPQGRTLINPGQSQGPCRDVTLSNCGWWWPAGTLAEYKPPNETVPTGASFTGSPVQVDRVPLFGSGHGGGTNSLPVSAAGKTVRFRFQFHSSPGPNDPTLDPPQDYGWRIDGVAVTEQPQFFRDVTLVSVKPEATLYDPRQIGVGPNTTLSVLLEVRNSGVLDARRIHVELEGIDAADPNAPDAQLCFHEETLPLLIPAGETRTISLPCALGDRPGALLQLHASVAPTEGDDNLVDNARRAEDVFELKATPDAAVIVDASPRVASAHFVRTMFLTLENRGNVPLSGFDVSRLVVRRDGAEGGTVLSDRSWRITGTLPVGARISLANPALAAQPAVVPALDLTFDPAGQSGSFSLVGTVAVAGDAEPGNDRSGVGLTALDVLYENNLDRPVVSDPAVVAGAIAFAGTENVWRVAPNSYDGFDRFLAGDPETQDLPTRTNASLVLPPLDLTTVQGATLVFKQRYDLEDQFDAARVEVSTDGGTTWRVLRPVPQPLGGLPDGYPSKELTGSNEFLDGTTGATAVAFTGRSEDLPGADAQGWISSEFDLASDPELRRDAAIDSFGLEGMPSHPSRVPIQSPDGLDQFTAPGWALPEPNAQARQRYWWVQNLTYSEPAPHSGAGMWWSGSAGEDSAAHPLDPVDTRLTYEFTYESTERPGERVLVSWWSWAAGDGDGGTGGARLQGIDGHDLPLLALARAPNGWRQYGFDVTPFAGQPMKLWFEYQSLLSDTSTAPLLQNNRGWFLDDVEVTSYVEDPQLGIRYAPIVRVHDDMEGLDPDPGALLERGWTSSLVAAADPSPIQWTPVGRGAAIRDGGWHVQPTDVPGQGRVSAWGFTSDNVQGYPHNADSRLVTPLVDLSHAAGHDARLTFDQWYGFESGIRCPFGAANPPPSACFVSATDGGIVEYQVFDEATGQFGPWRQLGARFDQFPDRLLFDAETANCKTSPPELHHENADGGCATHVRTIDRLTDDTGLNLNGGLPNRQKLPTTGYSALDERGQFGVARHDRCHNQLTGIDWFPAGHGSPFPLHDGLAKFEFRVGTSSVAGDGCGAINDGSFSWTQPWRDYPVSYVFSGQSPGVGGWRGVDWDLSPLLGQKVRFGFHAFSNPSFVSGPHGGWLLANIAVKGAVFQGQPALVRLHVATDGSLTRGEWSVDDVLLVGERFHKNLAIVPLTPREILAAPGEPVTFRGKIVNLGSESRTGVALGVSAINETTKQPYADIQVLDPPADPRVAPGLLPPGVQMAFGGSGPRWTLLPSASIPITIQVRLPAQEEGRVGLRLVLLEDHGKPVVRDGVLVPQPRYELVDNEVRGNALEEWSALARTFDEVRLVPPDPHRPQTIVADPATGEAHHLMKFRTTVLNNGTTQPDLSLRWEALELERKGNPSQQPGTPPEKVIGSQTWTDPIGVLARGAKKTSLFEFTPSEAGLYRIVATVRSGPVQLAGAQYEVLVGLNGSYYQVDFAQTPAGPAGWKDVSAAVGASGGGSPPALVFRQMEDRFAWGVSPQDVANGQTYCTVTRCTYGTDAQQVRTVVGLEGVALGPLIDLGRVPQGQASVTLSHGLNLEHPGDGVRVEVVPMRLTPGQDPSPAFTCQGGSPMAFALVPVDDAAHRETVTSLPGFSETTFAGTDFVPNRIQPLAPEISRTATVFGGPAVDHRVDRLRLDVPLTSVCRSAATGNFETRTLVNYTLQPRLHVGTLPGVAASVVSNSDARRGAVGWKLGAVHVSSTGVEVSPASHRYPVLDGAEKEFRFTVNNTGQLVDTVRLSLDASASTLPPGSHWIEFPQPEVTIAPGESRIVAFKVHIPADPTLSRGDYTARILATSSRDPALVGELAATLSLRSNPLPDLTVVLASDHSERPPRFEEGTVEPLTATVRNVGQLPSLPVKIGLFATDLAQERSTLLETLVVPELCATKTCGTQGSSRSLAFEWAVPITSGPYRLAVRADLDGRLLEERKSNNEARLDVEVVPLNRPDVAVTDLLVDGLGPDGVAEEGSLLTITAKVENLGRAPANEVHVRLLYDATELTEQTIPLLLPGETQNITAIKVVSRGEATLRATLILSGGDETRIDNNEFRRVVRIRGHDLHIELDPAAPVADPDAALVLVARFTNNGTGLERLVLDLVGAPAGWGFSSLPNPVPVAPNETGTAQLTLQVPQNATEGLLRLTLRAAPVSNPNAATHVEIPVRVRPHLTPPTVLPVNLSAPPGAVALPVVLVGHSNRPQNVTVGLAEPAWPHEPATLLLAPNGNATGQILLRVPGDAPAGPRRLVLFATVEGQPATQAEATLDVLAQANASAVWVGAPQPIARDAGPPLLKFDVRITNTGNVPLRARLAPIDLGPGFVADAIALDEPLALGASRMVSVIVRPQADAPADVAGYVELWIAKGGQEAFQSAARLAFPSRVDAPDLAVRRVDLAPLSGLRAGKPLQASVLVENRGTLDSPECLLFASVNGFLVETATLPSLAPGASTLLNLTLTFTDGGDYLILLSADGAAVVSERQEDNNGMSAVVHVKGGSLEEHARSVPAPDLLLVVASALAGLLVAAPRRRRPNGGPR